MLHAKWKWSHLIFGFMFFTSILWAISDTYFISNHLSPKEPIGRKVWLIGKGPYFLDTIKGNYHHLVSDFPLVELDPASSHQATIEGYENGKRFLFTEIRNDTLYVLRAQPQSDTIIVAIDEDYAALARVGARALRSVTLKGPGNINIPVNPYGANPGGPVVYKPEDWEKYALKNKILDLHFENGAVGDFFLETDTLNLHISNANPEYSNQNSLVPRIPFIFLIGKSLKTKIIEPKGLVSINAFGLRSDTVIVHSSAQAKYSAKGSINIHCSKFLKADLRDEMDIVYRGQPRIRKKERDFGRVINGNNR